MAQPIDVLLVSDNLQNINIAWRHFAYNDYSAKATTHVSGALECVRSENPPQLIVFYASSGCKKLFELYRALREEETNPNTPLIVLADPQLQKSLTDYIKLKNAVILGISVDDKKLFTTVKSMIK